MERGARRFQHRAHRPAVERVFGVRCDAGDVQERGHPVHRDRMLRRDRAGRHDPRPPDNVGHPDAAFGQVHLAADQRPVVGEALAPVVAGEDDERVLAQPAGVERVEDPSDSFVHLPDHLLVDRHRAALLVTDVGIDFGSGPAVAPGLPGPVRRRVVKAQQERPAVRCPQPDVVDRLLAQQVGQVVAFVMGRIAVAHEVVPPLAVDMTEVADAAGQRTEMKLVPAQRRPEMRRVAKVPLADQRGRVAGLAEQRRHRRMLGRKADRRAAVEARGHRFLGRAPQLVLVAPGDHREPGRRADRRVGVSAIEAQALFRHPVEARRNRCAPAVTAEVGIAEVVGNDEDEVGHVRSVPG